MADHVVITDRVQVDLEDLTDLREHVAIPTVRPLWAVFLDSKTNRTRSLPVYGFNAAGVALVLPADSTRLTPVHEAKKAHEIKVWLTTADSPADPPVPPFAPAPAGMHAVFNTGRRTPVVYYDALGRALILDEEEKERRLYVATEDEELTRIEGPGADA